MAVLLLAPLAVLGVALALVPRLRPWSDGVPALPAPSAGAVDPGVPAGKALIEGRIVDAEGEPVAGARVAVWSAAGRAKLRDGQTERHGGFSFHVDPGRVVLVAEHDEKGAIASAELGLTAGGTVRGLVLALGAVRVVRGTVMTEASAPIGGARLQLEGPPWFERSTTSGADGVFVIPRVPRMAQATLRASADGHAMASAPLASQGGEADEVFTFRLKKEDDIDGVVLAPDGSPVQAAVQACDGKQAGQKLVSGLDGKFKLSREFLRCPVLAYHDAYAPSDETLPENGAVRLRLKEGGAIAGFVVDESNNAVRSFYVGIESFMPAFGDREFSVRSGAARPFEDAAGTFLLEKLAPGSYVLSVGAEGRSAVRSPTIEVRAGLPTRNIKIVLARGGTVEGQIFSDEQRTPLGGARITFDSTTSTRGETVAPAISDEAGRFRLEGAPPGVFSLRVTRDGYRSRIVAGLRVGSNDVLKQDIGLKSSGDGGGNLEFVGIGATLAQTREGITFVSVFEGSPAERAGVRQGDLLRRIDGLSAEGLSVADAIQKLRGEKDTTVRITVERPQNSESIDITITRGEIVR